LCADVSMPDGSPKGGPLAVSLDDGRTERRKTGQLVSGRSRPDSPGAGDWPTSFAIRNSGRCAGRPDRGGPLVDIDPGAGRMTTVKGRSGDADVAIVERTRP